MAVRPIDANALARRIREYMDDFPNATTRLATCRAILSMLGDENQTPTLRLITREQVERVWRGEWEPGNPICPICGKDKFDGLDADIWADWMPNFCPHCGAPMTDKAVEMMMERMEALRDE